MKKRLLSVLLVAVMALSLVACGGKTEEPAEEAETTEVKDTFTYSVFSDLGTTLNYFTADSREAMTFVKLIDAPLFYMYQMEACTTTWQKASKQKMVLLIHVS